MEEACVRAWVLFNLEYFLFKGFSEDSEESVRNLIRSRGRRWGKKGKKKTGVRPTGSSWGSR